MKTRITKITTLLALITSFSAFSQHNLKGKVTNQEGIPVVGATVSIDKSYNRTQTEKDGNYLLKGLRNDSIKITISFFGYETQSMKLLVKGNDLEKNWVLNQSAFMIEEVQIAAVRADLKTPTTYTNLSEKEIQQNNFGQDLPYLLQSTPSTVVTSDAGAGVGYTGIRIRGVDPTRTNVTVNGIPLNDAESHGVFWVNMPDFASSSDNIQVQRGVGTSSNGAAAFGSSINIKSDNIRKEAYVELDNSGGSFNTLRNTVKVGTGLINNHFVVDARLSRIVSDGYVDRSRSNLKSFYLSGSWVGKKSILKAIVFGGKETTYQAWNGIPEAKLKGNIDSLLSHFYNNYYPGGTYQTSQDSVNLFNSDPRKYNYYTYQNETDNYQQDHYQLHFSHVFNPKIALNTAAHFTHGAGYYEQYRLNQAFSTYGLTPVLYGNDTISNTDLIRRRWLDNNFYGAIFSLTYNNLKNFKMIVGGGANQYDGKHFGEIIWARTASQSEINQHYYDNQANKFEASAYAKANYQLKRFNFFVDLQIRHIGYKYTGDDQYYGNLIPLTQNVTFTFFNPKFGFSFDLNSKNNFYASLSVANREPVRDDFVQSSIYSRPKPEQLQNAEVGYRFHARKLFVNANYYLMNYKDQLILTGQINDVGSYNRANVAKSYRSGVEIEAGYLITKKISLTGNFTLSANKIQNFTEYVDNYDNYDANGNMIQTVIQHTNTDIAFSPKVIAALGIQFEPIKNLTLNWQAKYVGKQYLDNTSNESKRLDAYFTNNLMVNYCIKIIGIREMNVGILANNILNTLYENNGYTFGYISGGKRINENYYFPQAGRNFLVRLTIKI